MVPRLSPLHELCDFTELELECQLVIQEYEASDTQYFYELDEGEYLFSAYSLQCPTAS